MTYEEMKQQASTDEAVEKTESFFDKAKNKVKKAWNSEEAGKLKGGFRDGAIYAIGYTLGKRTGNKAIEVVLNFIDTSKGGQDELDWLLQKAQWVRTD